MNDHLIHRYRDVARVAREGMRFRRAWPQAGHLITSKWRAERLDPTLIWRQPGDRLGGRVLGVEHH